MDPFDTVWDVDAPVPSANREPYTQYPPTLPHDVALAQDQDELAEVLERNGLTATEYDYIADIPAFRKEVSEWKQKIVTEGYSFKLKLRGIAEAYIPQLISLLHDPMVAPSVKTDLYKSMVKWAGLEPKKEESQGDSGNRITININPFTPGATVAPIDITPRHG